MTTLEDIRIRLDRALEQSFGFLVSELGYTACRAELYNADDPRDPYVVASFHRGHRRVEIWVYALTLSPGVLVKDFVSAVGCDLDPMHERKVELETAAPAAASRVPRPRWLKKPTLHEQMLASYTRFTRLMNEHFEEAVEFLAQRLRESGFAENKALPTDG
jgi:hypothetical protein